MANVFGDLVLFGDAQIINFKIEKKNSLPTFNTDDHSRLFVVDENLYFNDGTAWKPIQFANTSSEPLITSLGDNWINNDFSFNPTDFNNFDNISGLTSDNTLFDVLAALDTAISDINTFTFSELEDIDFNNIQTGDIIYFNGTSFSNINLNDLADAILEFSSTQLSDIEVTSYDNGQTLVYLNGKLKNKKFYFEYTNTASNTTFVIPHDLNVQYCNVQLINPQTNEAITNNYNIIFDSVNQLTVTIQDPMPIKAILIGLNLT